ncbi:ribonuclease HII [candidate division CPR3 bacterium 4484_211]|uniref:Ribonuclease HII n=1 Tax=candidate division CPR3 bacterium 4484_211 TaxID=1968527 RepID=A0A1W9NZN9_UNCC3|nr:MAG: ribonuclease HII [candidate division CPR3 bacterium 4484_211]
MIEPHWEKSLWRKGYQHVAGIDEAGRGALAGPLVSAAVVFDPTKPIPKGINDSKLLSPKRRQALALQIIKTAKNFSWAQISARQIDQKGISWATQEAFYQTVLDLEEEPDFIFLDAYRAAKIKNISQQALIKGDQKILSVAAASILAKVFRDWLMAKTYDALYPIYNFKKHKGYGTKEHITIIKKVGICPIHRKSYLNPLWQTEDG